MNDDSELTMEQRNRILRDVVLGVPPPADETPKAREWRIKMEREKAEADKAGLMLEIPSDL
ncbi:MAG: hypothetical protein L0211_17460 [Planctomycetaceae bacterium]|nr:hypothetical protein [Planctomycetaceae bacterium]